MALFRSLSKPFLGNALKTGRIDGNPHPVANRKGNTEILFRETITV